MNHYVQFGEAFPLESRMLMSPSASLSHPKEPGGAESWCKKGCKYPPMSMCKNFTACEFQANPWAHTHPPRPFSLIEHIRPQPHYLCSSSQTQELTKIKDKLMWNYLVLFSPFILSRLCQEQHFVSPDGKHIISKLNLVKNKTQFFKVPSEWTLENAVIFFNEKKRKELQKIQTVKRIKVPEFFGVFLSQNILGQLEQPYQLTRC